MDKRQIRRLKRLARKAETRINMKIRLRIDELKKDKALCDKIEKELERINSREDLDAYIRDAFNIARNEARQLAG